MHPLLSRLRLRRHPQGRPLYWQFELLLVAVVYAAYDSSRLLVTGGLDEARRNAHTLLRLEQWAHLAPEHWLNQLYAANEVLAVPADFAYASLHYLVTPIVLIWLWRRHHPHYRSARTWLGITTVLGLVGFILLPTAPPRLLEHSYGFADTMAQHSGIGWWAASGGNGSTPAGLGSLTNEFAAMPSLHVGWALWCGLMLLRYAEDRTVRVLGALYPVVIAVVVMGTGNHFLLDCLAGVVVLGVSALLVRPLLRLVDGVRVRLARGGRGLVVAGSSVPAPVPVSQEAGEPPASAVPR